MRTGRTSEKKKMLDLIRTFKHRIEFEKLISKFSTNWNWRLPKFTATEPERNKTTNARNKQPMIAILEPNNWNSKPQSSTAPDLNFKHGQN